MNRAANQPMNKKNLKYWYGNEQLNLTPLLDCIFILILFFLVATTVKEEKDSLGINLPSSSQSKKSPENKDPIFIFITNENKIFYKDESVDINRLIQELSVISKSNEQNDVIIKGDAKAYNQTIVDVLDACAKANLRAVSIEVKPKE